MANCSALRQELWPMWEVPGHRWWVEPAARPVGLPVDYVLFVVGCLFLVVGGLVFVRVRKRADQSGYRRRLAVRPIAPLLVTHLGGVIFLIVGPLQDIVPVLLYPCFLQYFLPMLIPPMLAWPLCIRLVAFYRSSKLAEAAAVMLPEVNNVRESSTSVDSEAAKGFAVAGAAQKATVTLLDLVRALFSLGHGLAEGKSAGTAAGNQHKKVTQVQHVSSSVAGGIDAIDYARIRAMRLLVSERGTMMLTMAVLAPYLLCSIIFFAASPMVQAGCSTGCFLDYEQNIILAGAVVALLAITFACILVRKVPDPFGIRAEAWTASILGGVPTVVAFFLFSALQSNAEADFSWMQVASFFMLIYCGAQSYLQVFLQHRDKLRFQLLSEKRANGLYLPGNDIGSHTTSVATYADFSKILSDPKLHSLFELHLIDEQGIESLRFYDAAMAWNKSFNDTTARTAEARAKKILNLYVGPNALFPVNFSDDTVTELLSKPIGPGMFANAIVQVRLLMQMDSYMRFLVSPRYLAYLEEQSGAADSSHVSVVA